MPDSRPPVSSLLMRPQGRTEAHRRWKLWKHYEDTTLHVKVQMVALHGAAGKIKTSNRQFCLFFFELICRHLLHEAHRRWKLWKHYEDTPCCSRNAPSQTCLYRKICSDFQQKSAWNMFIYLLVFQSKLPCLFCGIDCTQILSNKQF